MKFVNMKIQESNISNENCRRSFYFIRWQRLLLFWSEILESGIKVWNFRKSDFKTENLLRFSSLYNKINRLIV